MLCMGTHIAPRRDFQGLQQRRKKAAKLFAAGKMILSEIARELKASRQSVSRWYSDWRRGGVKALAGAGRAGRKPRLTSAELQQLDKALREGALRHGFGTDLWTLPRVGIVIERLTGVRYHPGHVWKILGAMEWTLQRPAKRAQQRDEKKVQLWLNERWPAVKKTLGDARRGSSSKTKAALPNAPQSDALGRPKAKRRS